MARKRKRWTVASARQNLPKLLTLAAREPQAIYRRDTLVASVVNPRLGVQVEETLRRESASSLADDLAVLRRLCAEDAYALETPERVDRSATVPGRVLGRRKARGK